MRRRICGPWGWRMRRRGSGRVGLLVAGRRRRLEFFLAWGFKDLTQRARRKAGERRRVSCAGLFLKFSVGIFAFLSVLCVELLIFCGLCRVRSGTMSTEAQIDLDWAGTNGAESGTGGAGSPSGANGAATASGAAGAAYLTDEEILGMEPVDTAATSRNSVILSEAKNLSSIAHGDDATGKRDSSGNGGPRNDRAMDGEDEVALLGEGAELGDKGGQAEAYPTEMPEWMAAAAADPRNAAAATELWREHQEFRAAFASPTEARTFVAEARAVAEEARAIKELLPGGVRDIVSLREATQSVERIDAALFSGDARAQADVVAEMARVIAGLGGNFRSQISDLRLQDQNENQIRVQNQDLNNAVILSEAKNPSSIGRDNGSTTPQRDSSGKIGPQNDNPPGTATSADRGFDAAAHFDAAAYAAFERS